MSSRRAGRGIGSLWGRLAVAVLVGGSVGGCFRPLYGPTASGENLGALLAAIEVETVQAPDGQERLGHFLRSELVFDLDGSGKPSPKRFRLATSVSERVQTPIVSSITGRAEAGTLFGSVAYKVAGLDGRLVTEGIAQGSATYDRTAQRFANVRAARDAEIRLAKMLSEQIKTRIASALSAQP